MCIFCGIGQDKIEHYYTIEDVSYRGKRMV